MTTLTKQVRNWTGRLNKAGTDGLPLMVNIINHMAKERDWDAAATLVSLTDQRVRKAFSNLLRARFGEDAITEKRVVQVVVSKDHPTGFRFKLGWDAAAGEPPLTNLTSTTWGIVMDALKAKKAFDNAEMHKALREVWGETKEKKDFDYEGYAKRVYRHVVDEDANIHALIVKLQAMAKKRAETVEADKPTDIIEMPATGTQG